MKDKEIEIINKGLSQCKDCFEQEEFIKKLIDINSQYDEENAEEKFWEIADNTNLSEEAKLLHELNK